MLDCAFTMYLVASVLLSPCALTGAFFAGINLSDQRQFKEQLKQELKQELELELLAAQPALKRSRTGWQEYSTLLTQDCDEVKLWNAEVLNRNVSSFYVM